MNANDLILAGLGAPALFAVCPFCKWACYCRAMLAHIRFECLVAGPVLSFSFVLSVRCACVRFPFMAILVPGA